jgi:hypothetical protein
VDVQRQDGHGLSALDFARKMRKTAILELLQKHINRDEA